ncbi:MAG: acetamidase/formamidase family protein [Phycisphaeraceae bacterium]|nr:acetamidase/formamidase family protein [Phycisphaeraceae bacterium]
MRVLRQRGGYGYTYAPGRKPIARVKPGEKVVLRTPDAFENKLRTAKDLCTRKCSFPFVNPQVGPIHVIGAEPGDTLAVTIHAIEPDRDYVVTALIPRFGGLTGTAVTAMLNEPLPEQTRILPLRDGFVEFNDMIRIPYQPFMGTIGVAPRIEAIGSLNAGVHGGNMDCVETSPGREVWFPVFVEGAHFYTGDAHAAQGDGELTGVACELAAKVTLSFQVIKGKTIGGPRIVSEECLMACGSARPLEDAARIAWCELIRWMVDDFGFDRLDAYHLLGQVGRMRLGNMVDPNYTMVAQIERKYLPPR